MIAPHCRKYWIAPHVHFCHTNDYLVLLDIRRNEFLGLPRADAQVLASSPGASNDDVPLLFAESSGSSRMDPLIKQMIERGMLTSVKPRSVRVRAPPVTSCLYGGAFVPFAAPIRPHHFANAILAWLSARCALRYLRIEPCLAKSNRRAHGRNATRPITLQGIQSLFGTFVHCRAWVYSAAGACLLDSIAVHDYLSRYGICSWLVVGVKTCPFAAHAWVQVDDCVINDQMEIVRAYTSIYASGEVAGAPVFVAH
jgi:transglutaminase superfamily protein